jgi:hypothetical protein
MAKYLNGFYRSVINLLGYFLCGVGWLFVFVAAPFSDPWRISSNNEFVLIFFIIMNIITLPTSYLGVCFIKIGNKLLQKKKILVSVDDLSPFALYLRSFRDDDEHAIAQEIRDFAYPSKTAEEDLISALESIGKPVIAIGKPGERLPKLGAHRYYVGDGNWQKTVCDLIHRSQIVVLKMGATRGLQWELEQCVRSLKPSQFLLWLPGLAAKDRQPRYQGFLGWASAIVPGMPGELGDSEFITFEDGWKPCVVPRSRLSILARPPGLWGLRLSQYSVIRAELLRALGRPEEKSTLKTFLLRSPTMLFGIPFLILTFVLWPRLIFVLLPIFLLGMLPVVIMTTVVLYLAARRAAPVRGQNDSQSVPEAWFESSYQITLDPAGIDSHSVTLDN